MKTKLKRMFDRKGFDQPVSYETSIVNGKMENIRHIGIALDISTGGMGLITDLALAEGSVVKFNIPMKEVDITLPVFAQVVWSKPDDDHFRTGLSFLM